MSRLFHPKKSHYGKSGFATDKAWGWGIPAGRVLQIYVPEILQRKDASGNYHIQITEAEIFKNHTKRVYEFTVSGENWLKMKMGADQVNLVYPNINDI